MVSCLVNQSLKKTGTMLFLKTFVSVFRSDQKARKDDSNPFSEILSLDVVIKVHK